MTREQFLTQFTDLIRAAFEHEGPDYGELLVAVYMMMASADSVRPAEYAALKKVFEEFGAKSRFAYDDGEEMSSKAVRTISHFEKSEVWRLVRRGMNTDWPDEL